MQAASAPAPDAAAERAEPGADAVPETEPALAEAAGDAAGGADACDADGESEEEVLALADARQPKKLTQEMTARIRVLLSANNNGFACPPAVALATATTLAAEFPAAKALCKASSVQGVARRLRTSSGVEKVPSKKAAKAAASAAARERGQQAREAREQQAAADAAARAAAVTAALALAAAALPEAQRIAHGGAALVALEGPGPIAAAYAAADAAFTANALLATSNDTCRQEAVVLERFVFALARIAPSTPWAAPRLLSLVPVRARARRAQTAAQRGSPLKPLPPPAPRRDTASRTAPRSPA
jgi:hypothetical protein